MATDDISLRVEMGRLEIEPIKVLKSVKEENPFSNTLQKRYPALKSCPQTINCMCLVQKKKNLSICKKKHKLLKEPILRLSQNYNKTNIIRNECMQLFNEDIVKIRLQKTQNINNLCLHTLVDNCNQLSISTERRQSVRDTKNDNTKWWKSEAVSEQRGITRESTSERNSGSCSQQALNPPCDVTIDELASYFETLVHIPKKMSSMAEMMYI